MHLYNIWRYNPAKGDIEVIMPNIEGMDQARDLAAARSVKTQIQHEYALVGGEHDQILQEKRDAIRAKREEEERYYREQIEESNRLIADRPYLKIEEGKALRADEQGTYPVYAMVDTRPGQKGECFYNAELDDLVWAVSEWLELHPIEVENKA